MTYTSTSGYTGADGFTFTVNDGHGGTATGTVTLKVVAGKVIDRTPPTITLTSPVHGAVDSPTDAITAAFSCADSTTSVASCTGTVANGAAINLAVGVHTFTVQAVDAQGNKAQQLVSYRVIDPTPVAQSYTGSAANTLAISCNNSLLTPTTLPLAVGVPTQVPVGGVLTKAATGQQSVPDGPRVHEPDLHWVAAPAGGDDTGRGGDAGLNGQPGCERARRTAHRVERDGGAHRAGADRRRHQPRPTNPLPLLMLVTMTANGA